jgi:hypothetical protein
VRSREGVAGGQWRHSRLRILGWSARGGIGWLDDSRGRAADRQWPKGAVLLGDGRSIGRASPSPWERKSETKPNFGGPTQASTRPETRERARGRASPSSATAFAFASPRRPVHGLPSKPRLRPHLPLHAAPLRPRPRRQRPRRPRRALAVRRRPVRVPVGGPAAQGPRAVPGRPVPQRDAGVGRRPVRVGEGAGLRAGRGRAAAALRSLHRGGVRRDVGGAARVGGRARPAAAGRRPHARVAASPHVDHADLRPLHPLLLRVSAPLLHH